MRLLVESEIKPTGIVGAGFDEFRWLRPVRPGDELRLESQVLDVRPSKSRPEQGLIKVRTTTLNQNGEAVQILIANLVVLRRLLQRPLPAVRDLTNEECFHDPSREPRGAGRQEAERDRRRRRRRAGLGAALCRRFAAQGYHVFVAGRTSGKIDKVAQTIAGTGGSAEPIVTDTTSEADVARLPDRHGGARWPEPDRPSPTAPATMTGSTSGTDREAIRGFRRVGCRRLPGPRSRTAARPARPRHSHSPVPRQACAASLGYAQFAAAKAGLRIPAEHGANTDRRASMSRT